MSAAQILCIAAVVAGAAASIYCLLRSLAADIRARQRRDATRLSNRDMPPPRRLGALAFAAALLFAHLGIGS